MTCGIYCLYFKGTDKVYIGQSENIEERFSAHKYLMKNGLSSSKLNNAYIEYGQPSLEIIEECTKELLTCIEDKYIEEFNTINSGFNTLRHHKEGYYSTGLRGELSPKSLYSNDQIKYVFALLVDDEYHPPKEIQKLTGVSLEVINSISLGRRHTWLQDEYPSQYPKLFKRTYLEKQVGSQGAKARGIKYPPIISPEGIIYTVDCITQFAREHSLISSGVSQVLHKKRKTHKGWHL